MPRKPKIAPRKPPPSSAAADFVSGKASQRHGAATSTKTTRYTRENGEELERLTIYLPFDLAGQLRVRCAEERKRVSDAVAESVAAWLKE